jgi:hypothetical protein
MHVQGVSSFHFGERFRLPILARRVSARHSLESQATTSFSLGIYTPTLFLSFVLLSRSCCDWPSAITAMGWFSSSKPQPEMARLAPTTIRSRQGAMHIHNQAAPTYAPVYAPNYAPTRAPVRAPSVKDNRNSATRETPPSNPLRQLKQNITTAAETVTKGGIDIG